MPKIVNHDEYRQKMLEKSLHLFSSKGYSNVNMKEIAAEIGVSTGTLYHYFSSKENMLIEMLAWSNDQHKDEYISRANSIENTSDRLTMIIDFWKGKGAIYKDILLLAIDTYRHLDIKEWKEVYSFFSERYINMISERLNISKQLAHYIFIYFIGISFHSLAFNETNEYNQQIDFLDIIFRPLITNTSEDMEKAAQKLKDWENKKNKATGRKKPLDLKTKINGPQNITSLKRKGHHIGKNKI